MGLAETVDGGEDAGDMAVGPGASDSGGVGQVGGGRAALEDLAEGFDFVGGPVGEVGEGAVADLAVVAKAFAQQDGWRGVTVTDNRDVPDYRYRTSSFRSITKTTNT